MMHINSQQMTVEIWSDIMCPFCYIGKRNYEAAIKEFADSNDIAIEWRSFQLDPSIPVRMDKEENVFQYLAERKGMSYAQSVQMHASVTETAKRAGLDYRFDQAIVANSFNAHRIIQMAKEKGLGDAAEERFFKAYFTEGKNIGNKDTLVELGISIGLTATEVNEALTNEMYAHQVEEDITEAQHLGVNGVPFFVFNRRYAVSGAQPPQAFVQALQRSFEEWRKEHEEA